MAPGLPGVTRVGTERATFCGKQEPVMSTVASIPPAGIPPFAIVRFSVEQYHEMARVGVIEDGAPIELLDGFLVPKMTKNPAHGVGIQLLIDALTKTLPSGWLVRSQDPITTEYSEPEPDISVVRGGPRDYLDRHPLPAEIALIVEVADSTLQRDRGIKKAIYARAGVVHYWILNLIDRQLETFADPTGPAVKPEFRADAIMGPTELVSLFVDGNEVGRVKVSDLLP
jgi:Uma2 family endonuclease